MESPKKTHILLLQIGILVALFLVMLSSHASARELSEESTNTMGNKTLDGVGDGDETLFSGTWKWWNHHLGFWKWWHAHKWLHHHSVLGKSTDSTGAVGVGGGGTSDGGNIGYGGGTAQKETLTHLKT